MYFIFIIEIFYACLMAGIHQVYQGLAGCQG